VLKLHHQESRDYAAQHLAEIRTGCEHLKRVFALEAGEDLADEAPTAIFDNWLRSKPHRMLTKRLDDFLAWLESESKQ
jgi:hypothetical protein